MANVEEMEAYCRKWMNDRKGTLSLQRTLYLVPGLDDEGANCWLANGAITSSWGPKVFKNWHMATTADLGTPKWSRATVRVVLFPKAYPPPVCDSFLDFGDQLREIIASDYPDRDSPMGEYDLVCHSMGGLDAMAALMDLDPSRPPLPQRAANAYNFVAMDTPFRGVPNMTTRRRFSPQHAQKQCDALTPGSPELAWVEQAAERLESRATRITCYGVDSATQVEVTSGNLYHDRARFATARREADYRFIQIPGSSHSGSLGITTSVITMANLFDTLTRGDRLSSGS
jgi:hypothetical protein